MTVIQGTDGDTTGLVVPATSWYELEAAAHASAVPQLTESVAIPVGLSHDGAILSTVAQDALAEGGALRGISTTFTTLMKAAGVLNPKTSLYALSFQASLATIAASQSSGVGLIHAASGQQIGFYTSQATNATNFIALGSNAGTTNIVDLGTADTNVYTWRLTANATTITLSRCAARGGGVPLATGTILKSNAFVPTNPCTVGFNSTAASSGQKVYKALLSYIGPA